jgi:hypothetical protein
VARVGRGEVLVIVGVTAALWLLNDRFLALRPILWLGTLVHEAGHATAATLLGLSVRSVTINPHGGGLMQWSGRASTTDVIITASAGYVGAALVGAAALEACHYLRAARAACVVMAGVVAAVGLLWVPWSFDPPPAAKYLTGSSSSDGRFTTLFCVGAVVTSLVMAAQPWARLRRAFLLVVATALCLLSIESLKFVLDLSAKGGDSDASAAAAVTPLSSWMWSALWLLFGTLMCVLALWSVATRREDTDTEAKGALQT